MKRIFVITFLCLCVVLSCFQTVEAFKDISFEEVKLQAKKGDPAAQTKLGVAYSTGTEVEVDKRKAADWYGKAADQGYPAGQWNLGFLYIRGEGVKQSDKKARELFTKAADQGFAPAEYDLGMMNLYGMGGERSRSQALEWMKKAADQGYKEAIGFLKAQGEWEYELPEKK